MLDLEIPQNFTLSLIFNDLRRWKMQIKKADFEVKSAFQRRERDSNPRYLSVRRFSRPVHSTTLPPLQYVN